MIREGESAMNKLEALVIGDKCFDVDMRVLAVASDPCSTVEVLTELARSEYENVRAAVASNSATPQLLIDELKLDKSDYVSSLAVRTELVKKGGGVHYSAIISSSAKIGSNVVVGPYTIIYDNVVIGDDVVIEAFCEIGHPSQRNQGLPPLIIGKGAYIRSHSIFYEGSSFGDNLVTGHRVTVREMTRAGRNLQIGTLGDVQGDCEIGDFVRFHSNVHVGQKSVVGNYVWLFPYVVLTNDPHPPSNIMMGVTLKDYVAVATMSVLLPGITVEEGALIGAHSSVTRDVVANTVVAGVPAKYICDTDKIKLKDGSGASAYPWRRHFHRGYLSEVVERWVGEFNSRA